MVLELLASSALKYLTYSEKFQFSCVHAHNSLFQLPLAFHLTSLCVLYKLQLHLYNKFFLKTIQYFSKIYSTLFHLHDKSTEKKYINIILHLSIYLSICFIFFFSQLFSYNALETRRKSKPANIFNERLPYALGVRQIRIIKS